LVFVANQSEIIRKPSSDRRLLYLSVLG